MLKGCIKECKGCTRTTSAIFGVFAIFGRWLCVYCDQSPQLLEPDGRARSSRSDVDSRRQCAGARVKHIPHGRPRRHVRKLGRTRRFGHAEKRCRPALQDGGPRPKMARRVRRWRFRPKMAAQQRAIFEHSSNAPGIIRGPSVATAQMPTTQSTLMTRPWQRFEGPSALASSARRIGARSGENHARRSPRLSGPSMASRSPAI